MHASSAPHSTRSDAFSQRQGYTHTHKEQHFWQRLLSLVSSGTHEALPLSLTSFSPSSLSLSLVSPPHLFLSLTSYSLSSLSLSFSCTNFSPTSLSLSLSLALSLSFLPPHMHKESIQLSKKLNNLTQHCRIFWSLKGILGLHQNKAQEEWKTGKKIPISSKQPKLQPFG